MRCLVLLAILGCSKPDNPPGTLTCKASKAVGAPDVAIAVGRGQLAQIKNNAEQVGNLSDCTFDPGPPKVALEKLEDRHVDPPTRVDPPRVDPLPIAPPPPPPPPVQKPDDDGVAGGVVGGVIDDPWGAPPPLPPIPPPPPPQVVPPTMLEGQRIAGDKNILPDDATKKEIERSGKDRVIGSFKLCLSKDGTVKSLKILKSTGFAAYDSTIQTVIQGTWKYRPYMKNAAAIEVCTAVTFIYSQKP